MRVAVEQRGAERRKRDEPTSPMAPAVPKLLLDQREQRQNAAFAGIVGAQDQHDVLQRDDEEQAPEDQRQHAEHVRQDRSAPPAAAVASFNAYNGLVPMSP